jgi:hypothetical protein
MHAYLADGHHEVWLKNIARGKQELPKDVRLMIGHGEPAKGVRAPRLAGRLLEAVRSAVERDGLDGDALANAVTTRVKSFLPTDDLLFLARLSVAPLGRQLFPGTS